ncbi:hypothetical protein [Alkalicoccobacillus murimartini]|uniref:Uncharacterized protein YpmS n=1 Tax=Alkalicoccobacillus murimartini TaxID=171685 RepID=A0ABT9YEG7_9BACI|nr:hypothetical protein [Alkalicoccobacillus murimartini]MDQ0206239.1 uncharacterized protein YpmS [Alkalicoccobacillus murimartini]
MSKKWTGQEFILLGAAVCTLFLMYVTILLPGSVSDQRVVDGIEDHNQESHQFVESEQIEDNQVIETDNRSEGNEKFAYKFSGGEEDGNNNE